ncbi:PREDICTED: uncharacterized protein LOC109468821 [Branchiostoma belcheri]|uniref:Uncharacterized protein LOC109468821 n=1 Tax=Branchiostoma belcheri TaxID=7741 RepID=A0A6P4YLZ6_BRABE|nr:PREDICTED: uncharacterized protein LOC109468821 [Branchiostoma belcheri]
MNNFQQQTFRPGFHPQGMMGGPGMQQHPRMMGNPQQHPGMMGQQGMMGGPQHRMAGPGMHPQGMMGAQQHRMGMPGQQGMMGAQHPRMAGPVVSQQGMMGAQRPMVSQQGMMGAQRPMVSQQGMMGAQRPVVTQQGMMGAQRLVVNQQGMMGAQRPVVNQQGMMGAQHPRMTGPGVCQPGMMGNQQPGMMGNQQPGMMGNQQPGMMGNQQQRMPGVSQQSMMGPRVNQQLMMRGQQQRMMGHAVSQQSMMGMQQQRMMGVNQQRSVGPGQMQQGMMGAHQHGPNNFPQHGMMGTTGTQQQRIMVTILPEHGAVGPAGSQRIVESAHNVTERQVIEINTSSDVSVMDRKQNGACARSNNVNIVISPQEDMPPRYDAPSSTANTSVSPRASTLRTLVEVPLSFDTEVSSEKQKYTKDVDHRLLKPDLDPGVLKDGDVDYRTLVPIRPAEDNVTTIPQTTPDKPSTSKDIPLKLLVKLKPLKPLQKAQPLGETIKTEPKTEPETSSPTKDDKEPSKPGLVPVPSKGSANKSKITLKLIDRTAKQKRTEQDSILSGIPNLLENSVQRLSLSMEPTQQEILSALEEDCGCMTPLSSAVDETMTERTPEVSGNKSINLKWPVSALSTEDRMETMLEEDVGSKVYSSLREESDMSVTSPEVVISEPPTTKSETVADSDNLSLVSGEEATELSERHNSEQNQAESEDILEANRPFLNHSKGPLKSFSLQDKEERQARDDELIQASLDAMVEPSEVQNIAVSFRNPIAEAFEPNKPGSPLLSLALKLTRLHKRNVTKSYNGRHLRRTISMIEEGMEAHRSSDTELQQQKNKRELRLVICRVFARSGESHPELKECPAATRDASEKSQDTRTVIVSEEAIKKEDAMLPSCFQDTEQQGGFDCEDFTPLNNNLPGVKDTQHSKNDNLDESSTTTSPKRKAFDDVDPPLPRKVARSNSPAVCSNAKLGTVHVKQEGGTITSLSNSTRNLFNTLSRSTNSHTDSQSRNSNNSNSHTAMSGEFSNLRLKLQSLSSSIDVSTVHNPETSTQNSQASVSRSSEGSEIKGQCNKCNKPIKANSKMDRTKSPVKEEELQCDIQADCTFKTGPTKSNCNRSDLPQAQENSKKGSQEARFKNQAEGVGSTQVVPKVEENISSQNLHSTCQQSSPRLFLPRIDSTVKIYPGVTGASHFAHKSQTLQSNSKSLHCYDQSYRAASEHTDLNSPITESKGRYNSLKNASGTLQNENGEPSTFSVTLNIPKVPSASQQLTKTVQNLPKESQRHQTACSSQSIPVILGREASESQTTKTAVSPGTSPHAKTFPSQKDEHHKSPKAQGKFFRVCQPPCKLKEGSMAFKTLQEESKNGVQGELVVKQEEVKMETSEEREGTTNSDVRKVEFSKTDVNQEDPSKWPQGISLQAMKHVVLVDLDCWPQFFQSLPKGLVQDTFVWGFQDAKTSWRPPVSCEEYCRLGRKRHFYLHPPCASADSAICMVAGKLDSYLPRHLPFTILSGLQGFTQLQHRWNRCKRKANLVDPNTTDLHNLLHHIFYTQDNSRTMS